jgi:chromosome partitioning protein
LTIQFYNGPLQHPTSNCQTMIISIVNHKGGTGKTTTTINLGSALAAAGQRVLVVDFDAQGSLSYSLGITDQEKTIAEALLDEVSAKDLLHEREGMHILPANETLADVELSLARTEERFGHLQGLLSQLPDYDFVLIDCPPSLSLLTINALMASHHVIVPMQMDVLALRGLDSILSVVERIMPMNKKLNVLGVLPVMIDTRKNIHKEIIGLIRTDYTAKLFSQTIRTCVRAAEAPSFGQSVVHYAPTCSTAIDYEKFAKEVLRMVSVNDPQLEQIEG